MREHKSGRTKAWARMAADSKDGLIERGVAVGQERFPWKTTHNHCRLAVETRSGGDIDAGSVLASANHLREGFGEVSGLDCRPVTSDDGWCSSVIFRVARCHRNASPAEKPV